MNKKWKTILNVQLLQSDKYKWGLMPVGRIKQSFLLKNDSELSELTHFIKDEIKLLDFEIKYHKKWSPLVYHKNTYISDRMEKRTLEIILKRINNKF